MRIQTSCETFEFKQALEVPETLTFASITDALNWLQRLRWQDSDLTSQIKQYLARCPWENMESLRLDNDKTLERLAILLHSRRIVVYRKREAAGGAPAKKADAAPAFPLSGRRRLPESTAKSSKTWISIELKDTDGNAMAGEAYKIELPGGGVVEGNLDRMGTAGVSGIDPGQCKVSFPRLAGSAWRPAGDSAN